MFLNDKEARRLTVLLQDVEAAQSSVATLYARLVAVSDRLDKLVDYRPEQRALEHLAERLDQEAKRAELQLARMRVAYLEKGLSEDQP